MVCRNWWTMLDFLFFESVLGLVFYIYIIFVLLTARAAALKTTFFRLFVFTGIFDIQTIMAAAYAHADITVGFGPKYEVATRMMRALTFTGFYVHLFGTLLMTINRFTSLVNCGRYNKPWPNHVLGLIFIVIIVVSYAITTELFFIKVVYKEIRNRWVVILYERSITGHRIVCAAAVLFYECASTILIAATIFSMRSQLMSRRRRKQEMGLIALSVLSVCSSVVESIFEVWLAVHLPDNRFILVLKSQFHAVFCFIMTSNAYGIIFLSSTLRMEIKTRWFGEKAWIGTVTSPTKTTNGFSLPKRSEANCTLAVERGDSSPIKNYTFKCVLKKMYVLWHKLLLSF